MIYILTGIAKSGKSLVTKEIITRYDLPVISTDFMMVDIDKSGIMPELDITASDSTVARKVEPFIYNKIKNKIQKKESCLFEGVHFNTDFSTRLLNEFPNEISILYLGYKDVTTSDKVKELKINQKNIDNDWIFTYQEKTIEETVSYMIGESKRVYEECKYYGLPYVEIYDITKQMNEIIESLIK